MKLNWITAPLLLMASLLGSHLHAEPLQQVFTDWQLSCDNINSCLVRSTQDSQGLVLQLYREAGPEGKTSLTIDYQKNNDEQLTDAVLANHLTLNGKALNFNRREWEISKRHISSNNHLVIGDFIANIRDASQLQLSGKLDSQQSTRPTLSLKGLKAALLAIDQQQGRVGTKSEWSGRGNKPINSVPAAPSAPVLARFNAPHPLNEGEISAITQSMATSIDNNDCSLEQSEREVHLYALSSDKALMTIDCDMGAYNQFMLAFSVSRQPPYKSAALQLTLPFRLGDDDSAPELINADYDPKTGELSTLDKGRGLGDCGVSTRWVFDGSAFRLASYTSEPSCDGFNRDGQWPVLWVTKKP